MSTTLTKLELLAPAGDRACFDAALEAGADAVYVGAPGLNARRMARGFTEDELGEICAIAHDRGRRVHLALNIDLTQGDLPRAAATLELAARHRVDAVIVRDPALLALKAHFPELEYHFSTQACIAGRADVEAARDLGVKRVVLARELSLEEITDASTVEGVETEVFAHGALCFGVSGRCLLSSWVGGRSGNRGQCTSPCRVPWTLDGQPGGTPLSMHDLSLVGHVDEVRAAGVSAVKIEGRMKNPAWVRAAVTLFRKAIDGQGTPEELEREASRRGATPGRRVSAAYLLGDRDALVEPSVPVASDHEEEALEPAPLRPNAAALLALVDEPVLPSELRRPDRVRLAADQADAFLTSVRPASGAIVEELDAPSLRAITRKFEGISIIAALPSVFFDADLPGLVQLVEACVELGVTVEANTWGGWQIAKHAGARVLAGPGLGVLNALAAHELARLGMEEVTASIEIDANRLEALISRCRVPCAVIVCGRPALLTTRVELTPAVTGAELEDARDARLRARQRPGLWELRPVEPFDVRASRLPPGIAHVVADLVGSQDPIAEWTREAPGASKFNFERTLG